MRQSVSEHDVWAADACLADNWLPHSRAHHQLRADPEFANCST